MGAGSLLSPQVNSRGVMQLYINYDVILSYGMRHNFIVGDRGVGKTYGLTRWILNKCIKEGHEFIWVRNTQAALDEILSFDGKDFLADHPEKLRRDPADFTVVKNALFYNDTLLGSFTTLGGFAKIKGATKNKAKYFIFDEFMPELSEVVRVDYDYALKSILQSLFRDRTDFIAFYTANVLKTRNNTLDFFKFSINPRLKNQMIQRNPKLSAVIFYFQKEERDHSDTTKAGDAFASSNVYTPSPLITDYTNNIDPECGSKIKRKETMMYVASDKDYFLIREYKQKTAVLRVKGISPVLGLQVYALHKKFVFGEAVYDKRIVEMLRTLWNRAGLVFKNESVIFSFMDALFKQ